MRRATVRMVARLTVLPMVLPVMLTSVLSIVLPVMLTSVLPIVLPVMLTSGCATRSTDISSDQMVGVVYAEDGTPVAGAEIRVDQHRRGVSDTFGRFRVAGVPAGLRVVSVTAEGYETAYREVRFENRAKLVRVDLVSYTALVDQILYALEERRWYEARKVARRMEAVDPLDPRTLLVRRILQVGESKGGAR